VSVEELEAKVLASIGYDNQTARPFKWTFQGKALTVELDARSKSGKDAILKISSLEESSKQK